MSKHHEISCLAVPSNLGKLLNFLENVCEQALFKEDIALAVRLAGEEACTNIINHAYIGTDPGPISMGVQWDEMQVVISIDDDAPFFSPTSVPPPDLSADWQTRPVGGLGWHLIHQVMDVVEYEQGTNGGNCLKMIKFLQTSTKT